MRIAFCIEKTGGLSLFGKRLSRDSEIQKKLISLKHNGELVTSPKSAVLFESDRVRSDDNYMNSAAPNDLLFIETEEIPIGQANEIYLFHWNRRYPADRYFDLSQLKNSFDKISTEHFVGSSHDKITLEIYHRKKTS